jgi:hypothetical protein
VEADFGAWFNTLVTGCNTHKTLLGFTTQEITDYGLASEDWGTNFTAWQAAVLALAAALQLKADTLARCKTAAREINTRVQANKNVGADVKAALGLRVYDETRTPPAAPTTRPLVTVDTSERLLHTVQWRDESTPKSRAKPAGVREAQVWRKVGAPAPVDASECQFVDATSKPSLVITYASADAGKPVHYLVRWKSTAGDFGPWSETVIATVGA